MEPTRQEQQNEGRTIRAATPRSTAGGWRPAADRTDPVAVLAVNLGRNDNFDRAAMEVATRYADLNELDCHRHRNAIADGHLPPDARVGTHGRPPPRIETV